MQFTHGTKQIDARIDHLIVAGWTGRDTAAVQHHIDELAAIGVAPPSTTPLFYQVSADLLTQRAHIQVLGAASSGEVEPVLIKQNGRMWLGLGSDHTDRDLETTSVAASKQACAKPCAAEVWDFADVAPHLDQITLRSWIIEDGDWVAYQDGTCAQILPLAQLAAHLDAADNAAMLCGTLPALGGVRASQKFRAEMHDPVRGRSIQFEYRASPLEIIA